MPIKLPARRQSRTWIAAGWVSVWCVSAGLTHAADKFTTGSVFIGAPAGWTPEQTPIDFLDLVGLHTKARWRQLYRAPPPTPSTDRPRAAFTLGALVGDAFLALAAEDVQQFRNTNQDILGYCRVLGLSDKVSPRLMAMAKLAEMNKWGDLRQEAVDGHQELTRLLREQRDDDLAILVDLGAWMRVIEMSASLAMAAPEPSVKPLCIGSIDLLHDLKQRFSQLSTPVQQHETLIGIGEMIDYLIRNWSNPANNPPSQEFVTKTNDKLKALMRKLTMK
jgi:hypothetical protein